MANIADSEFPSGSDIMHDNLTATTVSLVNRLPLEVLGIVLLLDVGQERIIFARYQRIARLGHTCRHWRFAVENTPGLWAYVNPDLPRGLVERILSRGFPLTIHWDLLNWGLDNNFDMILPSMSRCVYFDVDHPLDEPSFARLEAPEGAPLLEIFALIADRPDAYAPLDLFGGYAPRLKRLELGYCSLKWDSPLLRNLTVLSLHNIDRFGPTKRELAHVLSNNPELETLTLLEIRFDATAAYETIDPIVLPDVITLQLHGSTPADLTILMDLVRAPSCRLMNVVAAYESDEGSFTDIVGNIMTYAVEWGRQYMPDARYADISMHMEGEDRISFVVSDIEITWDGGDMLGPDGKVPRRFELELHGPSEPEEVLSFVSDMLSRATRSMIQVILACSAIYVDDTEDHFLPIVSNFPGVTSLYLDGELEFDYTQFGRKLARPITGQDGSQQWLFPQLEKLTYTTGRIGGDEFVDALRSRHNPLPEDPRPAPVQIEEVSLRGVAGAVGWTQELRRKVEEIIGEGNLIIQED